ncbi:MAG: phosphotransferase [Pirellulaceae bacterium]
MSEYKVVLSEFGIRDAQLRRLEKPGFSGSQVWQVIDSTGMYCLKRWPQEDASVERLAWIHRVLSSARNSHCDFVPIYLQTLPSKTIFSLGNGLWEMATWMPGSATFNQSPSLEKLNSAIAAIARFHAAAAIADTQLGTSPAVTERMQLLKSLPTRLPGLQQAVASLPDPSLRNAAARALDSVRSSASSYLSAGEKFRERFLLMQPVIRDIWHDHLLFVDDRLSGIIDYGAMRIDSVCCDWARVIASLRINGKIPWDQSFEILSQYVSLSDVDLAMIRWLSDCGTMLGVTNWIDWLFVEGREFHDRNSAIERFRVLCGQLELVIWAGNQSLRIEP